MSRASVAQRVEKDNAWAAQVALGSTYQDSLFGTVTFVGKSGTVSPDGWENYTVFHSGFNHNWSSATVAIQQWEASA